MTKTQVGMCFLSQFPAARKFIVEIVKHFSNGWAQGFVFTFSKDIELAWEDEGDDTVIKDVFAEVIEIIARAYGAHADIQSRAPYCLTSEADHAYGKLHNMLMQCRRDRSLFAADVHSTFSKFGYWGPSYTFAVHAMREALRYGKFRRGPEWSNAEPEYKHRGSTTSIPDTIPNLLSPTYQGRWACMSPIAIVHTVFFVIQLQLGVQVLVSEAGHAPQSRPAPRMASSHLSADQELMKSILLNCRGRTIRVADVRAASISKE